MRIRDLVEQTLGTIPTGTAPAPAPSASITGNTAQLQDPKMAAANLAQQQKQKTDAKNQIQNAIKQKQQELADLQRQLSSIK